MTVNPYVAGSRLALEGYRVPELSIPLEVWVGMRAAFRQYPGYEPLREWWHKRCFERLRDTLRKTQVILDASTYAGPIHLAVNQKLPEDKWLFAWNGYRERQVAMCGAEGAQRPLSIYWLVWWDLCPDCWPAETIVKMNQIKEQLDRNLDHRLDTGE